MLCCISTDFWNNTGTGEVFTVGFLTNVHFVTDMKINDIVCQYITFDLQAIFVNDGNDGWLKLSQFSGFYQNFRNNAVDRRTKYRFLFLIFQQFHIFGNGLLLTVIHFVGSCFRFTLFIDEIQLFFLCIFLDLELFVRQLQVIQFGFWNGTGFIQQFGILNVFFQILHCNFCTFDFQLLRFDLRLIHRRHTHLFLSLNAL